MRERERERESERENKREREQLLDPEQLRSSCAYILHRKGKIPFTMRVNACVCKCVCVCMGVWVCVCVCACARKRERERERERERKSVRDEWIIETGGSATPDACRACCYHVALHTHIHIYHD